MILLYSFFFNDTATTEIYTLSLHDALPISWRGSGFSCGSFSFFGSLGPHLRPDYRYGSELRSLRRGASENFFLLRATIHWVADRAKTKPKGLVRLSPRLPHRYFLPLVGSPW